MTISPHQQILSNAEVHDHSCTFLINGLIGLRVQMTAIGDAVTLSCTAILGGPVEKMCFFQMAPIPLLSVLI